MKSGLCAVIVTAGIAGFSAGIAAGKLKGGSHRLLSSEKVLHLVRKAAKESLPVEGAWIYLSPQTMTRDSLTCKVYRGGLTAAGGKTVRHYDFIADARTGTLIELKAQQ
ncbi:hypothetical protein [Sporolactobacillus putidus]|uniref:Peptidase M4 n=1 Tax=Sporolactobacillus putidus TaxID=492735 RepID=A0A917RXK1_9BACL|nr:hypothetical protein [Sporolactobacillus putidus]GGL42431.1 peptidase M4 [Sporolactobacillus putidus]